MRVANPVSRPGFSRGAVGAGLLGTAASETLRRLSLGSPSGVAIRATHKMDVMRTPAVGERSVHLGYIESAVRHSWMAIDATLPRVIAVTVVACQAADSLMYPAWSSVVARPGHVKSVRSMTLDTESCARIVRIL